MKSTMHTINTLDVLAERSKELYERKLKATLELEQQGKFVAVEPETESYFVGATGTEALLAARAALPDKLFHLMRVGFPAANTIGGYGTRDR